MSGNEMRTLSYVEKIQYEELKQAVALEASRRRERGIYFGFVIVAVIGTLLISGALKIDLSVFGL